ncbi:MAG: ABC transporter substrate-binding protein [Spirochaetes bacterium]|nr:ABC transporter substrate-binding protein [Spirochaetota bacterium]
MKIRVFLAFALVIALAASPVFAGGRRAADDVIRIAVAFPMTGDNAEFGQAFRVAAEIMVDRHNNAGGILGRQVELVIFDDLNSPSEAVNVAERIVSDRSIVGVLGHFSSGPAMAAAAIYQEYQVVQISPTASHPDFSGIGDFIFRNNTVINVEIEAIIDVMVNQLGIERVGVISIMTEWGHTAGNIAVDLVNAHPALTLTAHEQVLETAIDHRPAIANFVNGGTQGLIAIGMYTLYGPLAIQYREVDANVQLFGMSNAYTQQIITLGGTAVEGLIAPVSFFSEDDRPEIRGFVEEFVRRFGSSPSSLAAQAYDSMGIFLEGIRQAGSLDRVAVRNAIANISFPGLTGHTTFDANGDADKTFQKVVIRGGRFVPFP